nr:hypothetical protein P9270_027420 [Mesorhizobium sp. WSM4875]
MTVEDDTFVSQAAAIDLLMKIDADINALERIIFEMKSVGLSAFEKSLSKKSPAATAPSVALVLVSREIRRRRLGWQRAQ